MTASPPPFHPSWPTEALAGNRSGSLARKYKLSVKKTFSNGHDQVVQLWPRLLVALPVLVKLALEFLAGIDEHLATATRVCDLQEEGVVGVRSGGEHQQDGILQLLPCLVNGDTRYQGWPTLTSYASMP